MAKDVKFRPYAVDDFKSKILQPALTSHFYVNIGGPKGQFSSFLKMQGLEKYGSEEISKLNLLCSEVSLPGSSFNTHENNNDFTGVTERFAYRRVYDDRIELTFYVDASQYLPIRYFEAWMKYISNESVNSNDKSPSSKTLNYSYRFRYPDGNDGYRNGTNLSILKFERSSYSSVDVNPTSYLEYNFVGVYPISVVSMPISYDASSLLKCTVYMTYLRYLLDPEQSAPLPEYAPGNTSPTAQAPQTQPTDIPYTWTPSTMAQFNANFGLSDIAYTSPNGTTYPWSSSAGASNQFIIQ